MENSSSDISYPSLNQQESKWNFQNDFCEQSFSSNLDRSKTRYDIDVPDIDYKSEEIDVFSFNSVFDCAFCGENFSSSNVSSFLSHICGENNLFEEQVKDLSFLDDKCFQDPLPSFALTFKNLYSYQSEFNYLNQEICEDKQLTNDINSELNSDNAKQNNNSKELQEIECSTLNNNICNDQEDVKIFSENVRPNSVDEEKNRKQIYECKVCFKQYHWKMHLARHKKTHAEDKPLKCEICFKKFKSPLFFQRHIETHQGKEFC